MSVPVRCYSVDTMNNNGIIDQQQHVGSTIGSGSGNSSHHHLPMDADVVGCGRQVSDEMQQQQRMLLEGRLGTPDAADAVLMESSEASSSSSSQSAAAMSAMATSNGSHFAGSGPQDLAAGCGGAAAKSPSPQKQSPSFPSSSSQQPPQQSFEQMMAQLSELLALEPKYQPNLYLPQQSCVSTAPNHFFLKIIHNSIPYRTVIIPLKSRAKVSLSVGSEE